MIIRVNDSRPWWDAVPEMHRNIYRGKNLGDHVTEAQKAAIAAGTWEDLYVGDYWSINDRTWRIADFDYWLNKGPDEAKTQKHHIVVVPDVPLYRAQMKNTDSGVYEPGALNTTTGGYIASDMRVKNLEQAKEMVRTDFGSNYILNHRTMFTNAVKNGHASGFIRVDSEVDLMNEKMVYGTSIWEAANTGVDPPMVATLDNAQLALFRLAPYYIIGNRAPYWLRDVVSDSDYSYPYPEGFCTSAHATYQEGVRPAVGIVGTPQSADAPAEGPEIMDTYGEHEEV